MNIYNLLEKRLDNYKTLRKSLEDKDYETIYNHYSDVIYDLLFLKTKEEFDDFITMQQELNEEAFLLALSYKENVCCSVGMYENEIGKKVQQYILMNSAITTRISDDIEQLTSSINDVNKMIDSLDKEYIIIFDDIYCEGRFYIYYISLIEDDKKWESLYTERLL